jgi:hypothetical protein
VTDMAPDGGAGVIPIVYMTSFPPFGGGVHSMLTVEFPIPWMGRELLLRRTSLGGPGEQKEALEMNAINVLGAHLHVPQSTLTSTSNL